MKPFVDDHDFKLYVGDVRTVLGELPERSIHMCVTSPPYYGLRDYGTGKWEGGDPECEHKQGRDGAGRADGVVDDRGQRNRDGVGALTRDVCRCGAIRVDHQIGLEETPDQYVAALVDVFAAVRRVLRDDGTLWLNLGDSYATDHEQKRTAEKDESGRVVNTGLHASIPGSHESRPTPQGLKPKDLMGIPWRVAFALQADGWWLRQDNIWAKTSCMPESIEGAMWEPHYVHVGEKGAREWTPCPGCAKCREHDGWVQSWGSGRTTKSHEYMFQFAKSSRYYYDVEALREPFADTRQGLSYPNGAPAAQASKGNADRGDGGHTASARQLDGQPAPPPPGYTGGIGAYDPPYAKHGPQSSARPQKRRAVDLALARGLTDAHIAAIRACGTSDAGKAQVTQTGAGRNAPETQRLADEAKAALGGYYREFFDPSLRLEPAPVDGPTLLDEPMTLDGSAGEAPRGADGRRVTTVSGGQNSHENHANRIGSERWPHPTGKNKRSVWEIDWDPTNLLAAPEVENPSGATWEERKAGGEGPRRGIAPSETTPSLATPPAGRNKRSVWTIGPEPYSAAHFATFPSKLIIPTIKAGTPEGGVCAECGAPWLRMMERIGGKRSGRTPEQQRVAAEHGVTSADGRTLITGLRDEDISEKVTHGWKPSCGHLSARSVPAIVLDPFMGSGTTALTARRLGRHAVGVELNPEYAKLIAERTKQLSLLDGAE